VKVKDGGGVGSQSRVYSFPDLVPSEGKLTRGWILTKTNVVGQLKSQVFDNSEAQEMMTTPGIHFVKLKAQSCLDTIIRTWDFPFPFLTVAGGSIFIIIL
jgi:hypothetical protein